MTTYGVIGVGSIAEAIVTGLGDEADVLLSPRSADRAARLAATFARVRVAASNQDVVDGAGTVLVCVRPVHAREVLGALRFREGQVVISVVAGLRLDDVAALVAPAEAVARAIPLPTVATRSCVTAVMPPSAEARALFEPLGGVAEVDDPVTFDALAAATATVSAHYEYLDAIARWLASRGVAEDAATEYVASIFGAPGQASFAALAAGHATPGGLNEAFATSLREAGTYDAVAGALDLIMLRLAGQPSERRRSPDPSTRDVSSGSPE